MMKRRHFIQFAGSALGAIGLSQTGFLQQANHYGRAIAQSTPRKLALLIGINKYADPSISNLNGCLNDIDMQYQLLVNRYGFNPSDILVVSDGGELEPTRANILQAFEEHLIGQARSGDVVVVHYSGHGSKVKDFDPITVEACGDDSNPNGLNGTLVPSDSVVGNQPGPEIAVPDIMGRSLFLLTERIPTDNVTLVLDSCFSGSGTRGSAQVRAVEARLSRSGSILVPAEVERENQERWLRELGLDEAEFNRRRTQGIAKGVALGSASCNQEALELPFSNGAVSGVFTYLLTSYLWQLPTAVSAATIKADLTRSTQLATGTRISGGQIPLFEYAPNSDNSNKNLYFAEPARPFADAIVNKIIPSSSGTEIEVWLGGTSYLNLETASEGAIYTVFDDDGNAVGDIQLVGRSGLAGSARFIDDQTFPIAKGMLLREKALAIPNPKLRIGLHESLGEAMSQATAAFQEALPNRVVAEPVTPQTDVAYIFARNTEAVRQLLVEAGSSEQPPLGTLALFAPDFSSVVADSPGRVDETVTAAANRLSSRLRSLLVANTLQDLASISSAFNVSGDLFTEGSRGNSVPIAGQRAGSRSAGINENFQPTTVAATPFQAGEVVNLRIRNSEPQPIYLSTIAITGKGDIVVLHPANWNSPDTAALLETNEEIIVPRREDGVELRLSGSGFIELLTVVSYQPLGRLLEAVKGIAFRGSRTRGAVSFEEGNPLELLDSLLADVGEATRSANNAGFNFVPVESTPVSSDAIAVFSTIVEVIEE